MINRTLYLLVIIGWVRYWFYNVYQINGNFSLKKLISVKSIKIFSLVGLIGSIFYILSNDIYFLNLTDVFVPHWAFGGISGLLYFIVFLGYFIRCGMCNKSKFLLFLATLTIGVNISIFFGIIDYFDDFYIEALIYSVSVELGFIFFVLSFLLNNLKNRRFKKVLIIVLIFNIICIFNIMKRFIPLISALLMNFSISRFYGLLIFVFFIELFLFQLKEEKIK